jgi:lysophospholipase L1-like esterase
MGIARKLLRQLGTALGLALVTAATCEIALRIYNPVDLPQRGTQIVLPVNKRVIFENPVSSSRLDPEIVVTYNSLGFRGPDPPADWESTFTIVTVGGSTTHSARQSDGLDWPSYARNALAEEFENTWLNNAGLEGHSTIGHRFLLDQFLLGLHPRMVTFLVGVNDRGPYSQGNFESRQRRDEQSIADRIIAKSELLSTGLVVWRLSHAQRMGLRHWEFDLPSTPVVDLSSEDREGVLALHRAEYLEPFRERVTDLVRACKQEGIEPVLITQPSFLGDGRDPRTGIEVGPLETGDHSASLSRAVLDLYNEETRAVARDEGVFLIDLAREIPLDSTYFYDWIHFTNEGSAEVGRVVARSLIGHLRTHPDVRPRSTGGAARRG